LSPSKSNLTGENIMRRSILNEKKKEELIPKARSSVFDIKKSTVGMPTGVGDKSRAGWHQEPEAEDLPVEHRVAPGTADGMRIGRELLEQHKKMPVLAVEGPVEDIKKQPAEFIERKVGSEGEIPKVKKLTIMEKLFGVKQEVGEITPQYEPTTKVYRGRTSRRRKSQE
jgi:hypothetical protein